MTTVWTFEFQLRTPS